MLTRVQISLSRTVVHNALQKSSNNLPSYHPVITVQMLSTGGKGREERDKRAELWIKKGQGH